MSKSFTFKKLFFNYTISLLEKEACLTIEAEHIRNKREWKITINNEYREKHNIIPTCKSLYNLIEKYKDNENHITFCQDNISNDKNLIISLFIKHEFDEYSFEIIFELEAVKMKKSDILEKQIISLMEKNDYLEKKLEDVEKKANKRIEDLEEENKRIKYLEETNKKIRDVEEDSKKTKEQFE